MAKAKYWIEKAYENSNRAISKKAEDFWNENELWVFKDYSFKNITEPNYLQKLWPSDILLEPNFLQKVWPSSSLRVPATRFSLVSRVESPARLLR